MAINIERLAAQVAQMTGKDGVEEEVREAARSHAVALLRHPWNFLKFSKSTVTVANTASYTLSGLSNDCGKVRYLYYGGYELDFETLDDFNRAIQGLTALSTPICLWTITGYSNGGFPVIRLFGTPTEAGIAIDYTYQKMVDEADPFSLIPGWMMNIIRNKVLAEFYPYPDKSQMYADLAEKGINEALWAEREKHGQSKKMQLDSDRLYANRKANDLAARRHRVERYAR